MGTPVNVISSGDIVRQILKSVIKGAGGRTAVCGRGTGNEIIEVVGVRGKATAPAPTEMSMSVAILSFSALLSLGRSTTAETAKSSRIEVECSGENKIFHLSGLEGVGHRKALGAIQSGPE